MAPVKQVEKECERCGERFTGSIRQRFCGSKCTKNGKRTERRAEHPIEFIGVDGEGVTGEDGIHRYVLFSVGDFALHDNGGELHFDDILAHIWNVHEERPEAAFVGFYLGYDFTQWTKNLPEHRARMLYTNEGKALRQRKASGGNTVPFPVGWGKWQFDILGMKRFKFRPRGAKEWVYVCDVGSFFQSSFVKAIDPRKWDRPICTQEEYDIIVEGKARRSGAQFDRAMIRYNETENLVLSKLMERLNAGFSNADIRLSRPQWMGPGQASQKWLTNVGCPTGDEIREATPNEALEMAIASYYGGWFEIFAHGHVPGVSYEYDINSAYPFIISRLPCFLHGRWEFGNGDVPNAPYTLARVSYVGSDNRVGGLPFRAKNGSIRRPSRAIGTYWLHEIEASRNAGLIDEIEVLEWAAYYPCDCPPPLASIAELYEKRLEVGKNAPEGIALKLVYNSAYGKMAQSVGQPKYANPLYASLITAGCRTQILGAIASHPRGTRDLLMVATDGVYFRSRHPGLEISPSELGKWDETEKHNLTLFMPGMYWDDKSRAAIKAGGTPVLKSRGVNAADLATQIGTIDRKFRKFDGVTFPKVKLKVNFAMVSPALALARGKWETCGDVIENGERVLDAYPASKREPWSLYLENGVWWSYPYQPDNARESKPYDRRFGGPESESDAPFITPDGDDMMLLSEVLKSGEVLDFDSSEV